jgi:hypothetical protein
MGEGVTHKRGTPVDPLDSAGWEEMVAILDEELSQLPDRYRSPVVLCDLEGKTNTEAARQLGWPAGTLKTRLQRAREMLRGRLVRRGLTLSAAALTAGASRAAPPAALAETTLAGAVSFAGGGAAGVASAQAVRLARGMMYTSLLGKLKVAVVGLLALVVVGSGAGALMQPPAAAEVRPADPNAAPARAPDARADAFGDALPPGALARLGTLRWRNGPGLTQFAFTARGNRLVTAGSDGVLRVWDAGTGKEVRRWGTPVSPDLVDRWALAADGRRAAQARPDGTVRVVDVDTATEIRRIAAGCPAIFGEVALSPDGTRVALREGQRVLVWDVASGNQLCRITTRGGQDLVFVDVGGASMSLSMTSTSSLAFLLAGLRAGQPDVGCVLPRPRVRGPGLRPARGQAALDRRGAHQPGPRRRPPRQRPGLHGRRPGAGPAGPRRVRPPS